MRYRNCVRRKDLYIYILQAYCLLSVKHKARKQAQILTGERAATRISRPTGVQSEEMTKSAYLRR